MNKYRYICVSGTKEMFMLNIEHSRGCTEVEFVYPYGSSLLYFLDEPARIEFIRIAMFSYDIMIENEDIIMYVLHIMESIGHNAWCVEAT